MKKLLIVVVLLFTYSYAFCIWDKSSLVLSSHCENDTSVFVIKNVGKDMQSYVQYRKYLNNCLSYSSSIKLKSNDSIILKYTEHASIRVEVDQPIGHPGNSHPKSTENCYSIFLPIELLSFTAEYTRDDLILFKWSTASEFNNDYFLIEESYDALLFSSIGTVYSKSQDGNSYSENFYSNASYFRLKQVDFDGKYTYSKVICIKKDSISESSFESYNLLGAKLKYRSLQELLNDSTLVKSVYIIKENNKTYKTINF